MAETGIHPHVECVIAARGSFWKPDESSPSGIVEFEPGIRAALGKNIGHFVDGSRVEDRCALGIVENRERNAPCALTRDAPVWAGFHRATDAVAAPMWKPFRGIHLCECLAADQVDTNEKLFYRTEDHRQLRAPAMGIRMLMVFTTSEGTLGGQDRNDRFVGFENIFSNQLGKPAFFGVATVVVHRRKEGEIVLHAELVVILAMAGGDVNATGAGVERHKSGRVDGGMAIEKRMLRFHSVQRGADKSRIDRNLHCAGRGAEGLEQGFRKNDGFFFSCQIHSGGNVIHAGIDGDGEVRRKRPRCSGPDDH